MQNNYTKPTNQKSSQISKSNPKYAHLSADSQRFLEYCDKHNVPSIQKHIGHNPQFEMRPFTNGEPDCAYFCVRFLASMSYRDILTAWSIYELKDGGFLIRCDDFNIPEPSYYHLKYESLKDLERQCMAPVEVIISARKALRAMQPQLMIGIPQSAQETPIVTIRPKAKKAKLKTEAELKKLSDALLNVDLLVPTTEDNYWLMGRGEF